MRGSGFLEMQSINAFNIYGLLLSVDSQTNSYGFSRNQNAVGIYYYNFVFQIAPTHHIFKQQTIINQLIILKIIINLFLVFQLSLPINIINIKMKNRQPTNTNSSTQQKQKQKEAGRDKSSSSQQNAPVEINIDKILQELQKFVNLKPEQMDKKKVLSEQEIFGIARMAKEILIKQPALIEVSAPINVCGDIHGQYSDLLRIFMYGGKVPTKSYLFLGDYVDRGKYGIQTICLLFCLKIKYPNKIFLLRGNHETASITKIYGFYNECKNKYHVKIWKCFLASFANLPIAALIQGRILCMHGGLSPHLVKLEDIKQISRPTQVPDQGLLCDLLWADPTTQTSGWAESQRGCSYVFGTQVTTNFLRCADLDLVCRAHQVVEDGYQFCHKKRVVTLFSAPNYCKQFDNAAAFMKIDQNLQCQFHILKPQDKLKPFKNSRPKLQSNSR